MMKFKSDLHIHSVLSPCADLLMSPAEIVNKAKKEGIEVLALTDHNSAANAEVFKYFCEQNNIFFIPAMETQTKEEIHILCYFPNLTSLFKWQEMVYANLPQIENDEEFFGPQIKCSFSDEFQSKVLRFLAGSCELSLEKCLKIISSLGGVVIPSHMDRRNSIISQLGFIPPGLEIETIEISKNTNKEDFLKNNQELLSYQFIQNSDSHYLQDIKSYHSLVMEEASFAEFVKAIKKEEGRKIILNEN
ncbi:PHP domain-containing protein [Halanaerobium hydrogeniformans]|uniref:PHP domain protein n=1 Tax=Halanaerobium hydrogeniformans TaxID=656519 RepID=E4RJ65_HALHG|nr:PHP domain-containing protein [Halanaerobium hydrogeniformans]ADQ15285.1 PHP domain protein [Halanaerobium hydrogeniformans]